MIFTRAGRGLRLGVAVALALAFLGCVDVEIEQPVAGGRAQGLQEVLVATDGDPVSRVRGFINGAPAFQDDTAPFQHWWDTTAGVDGLHTLHVVAYDASGTAVASRTAFVDVYNDTSAYGWAADYAPVIRIDKDCLYRPCAVDFDGNGDLGGQKAAYDARRAAGAWPAPACTVHVLQVLTKAAQKVFVFDYWFYYPYNEQPITSSGATVVNRHDHDWERVVVVVPKLGGPPSSVRFHHHTWDNTVPWSEIRATAVTDGKKTFRPAMYIFNEGHGSYAFASPPSYEKALGGAFEEVLLADMTVIGMVSPAEQPVAQSGTGYQDRLHRRWNTRTSTTGSPQPPQAGSTIAILGVMPDDTGTPQTGGLPTVPWSRQTWAKPLN